MHPLCNPLYPGPFASVSDLALGLINSHSVSIYILGLLHKLTHRLGVIGEVNFCLKSHTCIYNASKHLCVHGISQVLQIY